MIPTCLCLLLRGEYVLLGRKKTGLGAGNITGVGGHVEPGETASQAAARELKEETGVAVDAGALLLMAELAFAFPTRPSWDQTISVFTATEWDGEPRRVRRDRPGRGSRSPRFRSTRCGMTPASGSPASLALPVRRRRVLHLHRRLRQGGTGDDAAPAVTGPACQAGARPAAGPNAGRRLGPRRAGTPGSALRCGGYRPARPRAVPGRPG